MCSFLFSLKEGVERITLLNLSILGLRVKIPIIKNCGLTLIRGKNALWGLQNIFCREISSLCCLQSQPSWVGRPNPESREQGEGDGDSVELDYNGMLRHAFEHLEGGNILWHIVGPPPPVLPIFSLFLFILQNQKNITSIIEQICHLKNTWIDVESFFGPFLSVETSLLFRVDETWTTDVVVNFFSIFWKFKF